VPYQGDGQFYRNADEIDELLSTVIDLLEGLKK
jgi:hypothetical protein